MPAAPESASSAEAAAAASNAAGECSPSAVQANASSVAPADDRTGAEDRVQEMALPDSAEQAQQVAESHRKAMNCKQENWPEHPSEMTVNALDSKCRCLKGKEGEKGKEGDKGQEGGQAG